MNDIALVGQSEMQRTLQMSYDVALNDGTTAEGVKKVQPVQNVTNDKGLTVERVSKDIQSDVQAGELHTIGAPDIPEEDVKDLLANLVQVCGGEEIEILDEKEIERVQEENDNAAQESAMKRKADQQQSLDRKVEIQLFMVRKKVADMPQKTEAGEICSKVFKAIGAAYAVASAATFTVLTGGGGVPALVAACIGFASTITDVSGGYKKLEEEITNAFEKNGKNHDDAARIAGFISMGVQLGVELTATFISLKEPPTQNVADTINKVKKVENVTKLTENKEVLDAATKAATKIFGENPTTAQVETVIKQGEMVALFDSGKKYVDAALKFVTLGVDIWNQVDSSKKTEKNRMNDAELDMKEVDTEQTLNALAACGKELDKINKRIKRGGGQLLQILDSANDSKSQINDIVGGMV